MLDSNVKQLLNEQVNKEFYSAYLYLDFSNFYTEQAWTALPTGTMCRRRRSATTPCCSCSICRTTAQVTLDAIDKPNMPVAL